LKFLRLGIMDIDKGRRIFGKLGNVSLVDIIQLLGMTKRTATLVLDREGENGKIFFKDGRVLHAFVGSIEGEEAIVHLLEWVEADFIIEEGIATLPKITISKHTDALVLTTFTKLDETKRGYLERTRPLDVEATTRELGLPSEFVKEEEKVEGGEEFVVPGMGETKGKRFVIPLIVGIAFAAVLLSLFLSGKLFGKKAPPPGVPPAKVVSESAGEKNIPAAVLPTTTIENKLPDEEPTPQAEMTRKAPSIPEPVGFGYLLVVVDPWAEVMVDGKKMGETPLGKIRLPAGDHTLTLTNNNFAGVISDRIIISRNATLTRRYSFNVFGYLQIVVTPWAEVYIDGRHIGQTPMGKVKLPVGKHTVILRHPRSGEKRREIEIKSEETVLLKLEM
jgi:hypothetical protein